MLDGEEQRQTIDPATGLPCDVEAEQIILGHILRRNEHLDGLCLPLTRDHFFEEIHQRAFDAIQAAYANGRKATAMTLRTALGSVRIGDLDGPGYLAALEEFASRNANLAACVQSALDSSTRRGIVRIANEMQEVALTSDGSVDPQEFIKGFEDSLYKLATRGTYAQEDTSFDSGLDAVMAAAERSMNSDGSLTGLSAGIASIDSHLGGFQKSDLIILAGRPAMGKAQSLDAPILRSDGAWTRMGDLRVGDKLASHDGSASVVTGIFPQGVRQLHRITFSDGRSTECCAEHLWRVAYREWSEPRVVTTGKLMKMLSAKRYRGRIWVDLVSGDFGQDVGLPMDAYVLGSLLANGSSRSGAIRLTTPYGCIIEKVGAIIGSNSSVIKQVSKYDYSIVGTGDIGGNATREGLRALGLLRVKSEDKCIPPAYLSASRETRARLLQGLMDGDGWVEKFGAMRYGTSSRRLAVDVQNLVRSLGGLATIAEKIPHYSYRGETRRGLKTYIINIRFSDGTPYVSVPSKLERVKRNGNPRLTVTSIEPSRMAEAQCISVSHPDHLYVTNDYIVTHNTALAVNIAFSAAKEGKPVAFFSLEMSKEQLSGRIVSQVSGVSMERVRKGMIDHDDMDNLKRARAELRGLPLEIDATGGLTVAQLASRARKLHRQKKIELIVVDYLQLLAGSAKSAKDGRVQEVTEITVKLKGLAKELSVPIIALSQLSRQLESRDNKRPMLADLRESGSIEQDADLVMFVYRDEYYLEMKKPDSSKIADMADWEERLREARGKAELIIGKFRHGQVGTVFLNFDGGTTTFSDPVGAPRQFDANDIP